MPETVPGKVVRQHATREEFEKYLDSQRVPSSDKKAIFGDYPPGYYQEDFMRSRGRPGYWNSARILVMVFLATLGFLLMTAKF